MKEGTSYAMAQKTNVRKLKVVRTKQNVTRGEMPRERTGDGPQA